MLGQNRDLHNSASTAVRSRLGRERRHLGYRPKFTITPHLSALIADIETTREKFSSQKRRMAFNRDPQARLGTPALPNAFTLERVLAMANGEDFPVVTESEVQAVLDFFDTQRRFESRSGKGNWTHIEALKLHKVVTAGEGMDQGRAGIYRSISVCALGFVPPPPALVPKLMGELLEWWNTNASRLPAVITSAILHYRISDIHPFSDGNGRFARALALWQLFRSGFDDNLLSLNGHYWGKRRHYYAALRAVSRQSEDLTSWLEYSAEQLRQELAQINNEDASQDSTRLLQYEDRSQQ
jgi:prophage maintenance system killer protein